MANTVYSICMYLIPYIKILIQLIYLLYVYCFILLYSGLTISSYQAASYTEQIKHISWLMLCGFILSLPCCLFGIKYGIIGSLFVAIKVSFIY